MKSSQHPKDYSDFPILASGILKDNLKHYLRFNKRSDTFHDQTYRIVDGKECRCLMNHITAAEAEILYEKLDDKIRPISIE